MNVGAVEIIVGTLNLAKFYTISNSGLVLEKKFWSRFPQLVD